LDFDASNDEKLKIALEIDGTTTEMEIDTAASVTIINEQTWSKCTNNRRPWPTDLRVRDYSGNLVPLVGEGMVQVRYADQEVRLPVVIAGGTRANLLGRNWLRQIQLKWHEIFSGVPVVRKVTSDFSGVVQGLCSEFAEVFAPGLGTWKGPPATVRVKPGAIPKFYKPRPVTFALREKVEQALEAGEKDGQLERNDHSEWAAPIVPVMKKDGSVRVCSDFKVTVNPELLVDRYPYHVSRRC
jgi:hypothetical protein